MFFKTVLHIDQYSQDTPSIGFHSYSQELVYMYSCNKVFLFILNLRILSFSQVRFKLCPIQFLKHFTLPQHMPTQTTNI